MSIYVLFLFVLSCNLSLFVLSCILDCPAFFTILSVCIVLLLLLLHGFLVFFHPYFPSCSTLYTLSSYKFCIPLSTKLKITKNNPLDCEFYSCVIRFRISKQGMKLICHFSITVFLNILFQGLRFICIFLHFDRYLH